MHESMHSSGDIHARPNRGTSASTHVSDHAQALVRFCARVQAATGICDIDQLVQNFIDAEEKPLRSRKLGLGHLKHPSA